MDNIELMAWTHAAMGSPDKYLDFDEFHHQLTEGWLDYVCPQDSLRSIEEYKSAPVLRSILLELGMDQLVDVSKEDILKFKDLARLGSDAMERQ